MIEEARFVAREDNGQAHVIVVLRGDHSTRTIWRPEAREQNSIATLHTLDGHQVKPLGGGRFEVVHGRTTTLVTSTDETVPADLR